MITNYRHDFFQYENLDVIRGEPYFETLITLKNQIKANAQSVPSTLGGGAHGLLGLVLTPIEYALVSNTPFAAEPHPGPLHFPPGTTAIQSKMIQNVHEIRLKNYSMCMGIEKALIQQLVKAVEEEWIHPLRNQMTNAIQGSIPDILHYLFTSYGDVSPDSLISREQQVKDMVYDPVSEPIDTVFSEVTKLIDYASAAGAPYTRPQTINIAYVILKKLRVFNTAITEWNRSVRTTPARNTWMNFKTHFRTAYNELKEVEELRVADSPFNSANLVSQIVDAVQDSIVLPSPDMPITPSPSLPQANNTTMNYTSPDTDTVTMTNMMQQMMQMNQALMSNMQNMQTQQQYSPGRFPRGGGSGRGNSRGNGRGRVNGRGMRRERVMRYCHTCGWCTHDGNHCRTPAEGHKANATIHSCMGGSISGFPPGCVPTENTNISA